MHFLKRIWLPFLAVVGIGLGITVPLLLAIKTDNSSSNNETGYIVILAALIALGFSVLLILGYFSVTVAVPNLWKRTMVWVTLKTVQKAVRNQSETVEATGITAIGDGVGIGLAMGSADGIIPGHQFVVLNAASQERWGVLEVSDVWDDYCVCSVFDRMNPEFWADLERRMRYDASPPQGVTIRREIPGEKLLDWLEILLKTWRN